MASAAALRIDDGQNTTSSEDIGRLVRGRRLNVARFDTSEFPNPTYPGKFVSLYDLQDKSRQSEAQEESIGQVGAYARRRSSSAPTGWTLRGNSLSPPWRRRRPSHRPSSSWC